MSKVVHQRVKALLVSAVMAVSSVAVTSVGSIFATAAGTTVTVNKSLESSIEDPEDPDHPQNESKCTYFCKKATDTWTKYTDTKGKAPVDLLGKGVTTLQFNLKADQMVTEFAYYFGATDTEDNNYWWDIKKDQNLKEAPKCTPFATEFSVVIEIPSRIAKELEKDSSKFQFQNCYAATASLNETTNKVEQKQKVAVTLESITVNGTTDTSNGTAPDWFNQKDEDDYPGGPDNTGGLYYSSATGNNNENYTVSQDGENMTITTRNSVKIEGDALKDANGNDYVLTPGDNCSEEYYATEAGGGLKDEKAIRAQGLPLNSHKFTYGDFNFIPGTTVPKNAKPVSLSVTLKTNTEVSRVMYGGGLNVAYMSLADTEYAKLQAGLKEDKNAGYWYNDIGAKALDEADKAGVKWGNDKGEFTPTGGSDLAKQNLGSYFTVTWDVPEDAIPYTLTALTDQISIQLWYAQAIGETEFTDATIVDATLTYEESITFPYTDSATIKSAGSASIGDNGNVEISYADFGMKYEKIADVYAVKFDITTDQDVNQMVVGIGTTVLDTLQAQGVKDTWFQSDDLTSPGKLVLLNWEKSTAGNRPKANDDSIPVADYKDATGKTTYTYMWIPAPTIATGMTVSETGQTGFATNYINAEEEGSNLKLGVWYAGLGEKQASKFTLSNVTAYYKADDKNNSAKIIKTENELTVTPETVDLIEGTSQMLLEDGTKADAIIKTNVENCTFNSAKSAVKATANEDGLSATLTAKAKAAGTTVEVTVKTPGGQEKVITVNIVEDPEKQTTTTTPPVTTTKDSVTTTTTTSTTKTTTSNSNVTTEDLGEPLYGDVTLDGKVNLVDAVLLNTFVANSVDLNAKARINANVYYDEEINGTDAITLLKFLTKIYSQIGPGAVYDD